MKMRLRDSPGLWDSSEWLLISSRLPRLWDSWDSYLLYLKFCQELWYYSARGRPHGKNLKFEGEQLWSAAVLHWDHCTEAALWKENGRIETWFNFQPHCPPSALNDKVWISENLADLQKSSFSAILRRLVVHASGKSATNWHFRALALQGTIWHCRVLQGTTEASYMALQKGIPNIFLEKTSRSLNIFTQIISCWGPSWWASKMFELWSPPNLPQICLLWAYKILL